MTITVLQINEQLPLTDNERYLVETIRTLLPFERVEITADKMGKLNNFIVIRSKKVILTDTGPIYAI